MKKTSRFLTLVGTSLLATSGLLTSDAHACGGCFHQENPPGPEVSVVTGHRMAFAISPQQTVLWDQVEYTGSPQEFAWVLPVKPGARLELASNSWFDTLDAATSTRVIAPTLNCAPFNNDFQPIDFVEGDGGSFGCCMSSDASAGFDGAAGGEFNGVPQEPPPPPPVTIVDRATVGPYEVLTLQANVPGVLVNWLQMNGFAADESIQPIIDQYQQEGFDFIAMKLQPNQGVQAMKPVRVVSPGASPALPLRMVAAGTGAETAVTLFVIGEGRWEAENFPNVAMYPANLSWDYRNSASDYAERRLEMLALNEGRSWLTSYSHLGGLLKPIANSQGNMPTYQTNSGNASTIAEFFTTTALDNFETSEFNCAQKFNKHVDSMDMVVDLCPDANMPCNDLKPGEIDSRDFECGAPEFDPSAAPLDDLAVAMVGQHPGSLWLTRIEGNLSRKALETDLTLAPEAKQQELDNWIVPGRKANVPCTEVDAAAMIPPDQNARHERRMRREFAAALLGLFGLCSALARRAAKAFRPIAARA